MPSALFPLSAHSSMHPPCCSQTTGWLGPSNKCINVTVGCGVQITLEMGKQRQKVDFSPGDRTLCVQTPHRYYLEAQPALGADKERTDSSPWGVLFWVSTHLGEPGERPQSCHTACGADVSVWHLSAAKDLARGAAFCHGPVPHSQHIKLTQPLQGNA